MSGRLVTFSGIDCSGKSTQIQLLADALRARGERPSLVWFRPGYGPEVDALRAAVRRLRPGALPKPKDVAGRERAFARPSVRRAWIGLATVDTLLQYALKVRAMVIQGRTVICDRYVADAMLDLRLRFTESAATVTAVGSALAIACPRPSAALLLLLSHEEMLRRMEQKREPFPDSPKVRDRRFEAYSGLAREPSFTVVNAERSISCVHDEILSAVLSAPRR